LRNSPTIPFLSPRAVFLSYCPLLFAPLKRSPFLPPSATISAIGIRPLSATVRLSLSCPAESASFCQHFRRHPPLRVNPPGRQSRLFSQTIYRLDSQFSNGQNLSFPPVYSAFRSGHSYPFGFFRTNKKVICRDSVSSSRAGVHLSSADRVTLRFSIVAPEAPPLSLPPKSFIRLDFAMARFDTYILFFSVRGRVLFSPLFFERFPSTFCTLCSELRMSRAPPNC